MMASTLLKPVQFSRSRSSDSSASSLSSAFSDIITSSTSESSATSKTNAFFASPFSTRPPSPIQPQKPEPEQKPQTGSLTADFFATPVRLPSPPPTTTTTTTTVKTQRTVHPSRIFPSRYTSTVDQENQKLNHQPQPKLGSELVSLDDDDDEVEEEPHPGSIISLNPDHSIPQFSFSPVALTFPNDATLYNPLQDDLGTPTPTNEPSSEPSKKSPLTPSTSSSAYFSLPTSPSTSDDSTSTPTLRLLRSLGHGAFSDVWLAEDLSPIPLTLVSKKSVRDLRRRVSGRDKEREREKQKEKRRQREKGIDKLKGEAHFTTYGTSPAPKEVTNTFESSSPRHPPRKLRDGLRSMLTFSRLPKLGPSSSYVDNPLAKSPVDTDPSWNGRDLPSPNSLHLSHQDLDMDMDSSALSHTSSIRSCSSYSSLSGEGGLLRHPTLFSAPTFICGDSTSLSRDSSLKKFRDRVKGTRPTFRLGRAYLDERHGEMGWKEAVGEEEREDEVGDQGGQIPRSLNLSRHSSLRGNDTNSRLVAVKMTPRKVRGAKGRREKAEEERTRVGFVREVEVLKHISHPNITPLLVHLSTPSHHILVLPYLSGGDLLGLVNNDVAWGKLGQSVLRRIWCELCKAVGWMHGVGLVHRDIKLENILLTTPAFNSLTPASPPPTLFSLPTPPAPLIKLTDFGLSRFVEIDVNGEAELLSTRCGSEAYAAPELVTGGGGGDGGRRGVYDARKTDAWACGVVLYALVGRQLPFGEGAGAQSIGSRIGGERDASGKGSLAERRHWLMRIARGEYEWPGDQGEDVEESQSKAEEEEKEKDELFGSSLMHSRGARRIVGRLLVRDPGKRARIGDLWDDPWMTGTNGGSGGGGGGDEGWWKERWKEREKEREWHDSPSMMIAMEDTLDHQPSLEHEDDHEDENSLDMQGQTVWIFDQAEIGEDSLCELGEGENGEEEEEEEGCLFDHEGIDSITRQEVV